MLQPRPRQEAMEQKKAAGALPRCGVRCGARLGCSERGSNDMGPLAVADADARIRQDLAKTVLMIPQTPELILSASSWLSMGRGTCGINASALAWRAALLPGSSSRAAS